MLILACREVGGSAPRPGRGCRSLGVGVSCCERKAEHLGEGRSHLPTFTWGSQEDKEGEGKKGKEAGEGEREGGERGGKWWIIRRKSPPKRRKGGWGGEEEARSQRREEKEEGEGGVSNDH